MPSARTRPAAQRPGVYGANRDRVGGIPLEVDTAVMRKRYRVLIIAAFVAALVAPVGYALSLEPQPGLAHASLVNAPFAAVPDAGKLVLVGSFLFVLSAIVRKST